MIYLVVGIFFLCVWVNVKGLKRLDELQEEIKQINQQHIDNY